MYKINYMSHFLKKKNVPLKHSKKKKRERESSIMDVVSQFQSCSNGEI